MRRTAALALFVALAALVLAGCTAPASSGGASSGAAGGAVGAAKTASVEIKEFAFQPSTVEVAVGGTVKWANADSATHTVKGEGWGSGDLAQGATYENTFATAGTFPYSCGVHPSMTGEVVVK